MRILPTSFGVVSLFRRDYYQIPYDPFPYDLKTGW